MNKKERKKKIYEEIRAGKAEYDERTRRLKARIEGLRRQSQEREAS